MELRDVVARIDERTRPVREEFRPELSARRPFLISRRRRSWQYLVIALALVLVAGGSFMLQGSRSTQVPLDSVVERFRDHAVQQEERRVSEGIPGTAGTPGRVVGSDVPRTAPEEGPAAGASYTRPAEGVYSFRATGGEQLSMFGAEHTYPERVYATVRHLEGCGWEATLEVIEEHTDVMRLCSTRGRFLQTEQRRTVEFFGIRDGLSLICDPPMTVHLTSETPGASSLHPCSDGQGGEAKISRTFVEETTVKIGERTERAIHAHLESTLTGRARGTSTDDVWVSPTNGLLYRWKRSVDTDTDAAFGVDAHYTEDADFVLESLEPQR